MTKIVQVYRKYTEWEDYQNGMFEFTPKENEQQQIQLAANLLKNEYEFLDIALKVVNEWKIATLINLTNTNSNNKSWLGQASCCYKYNVSETNTRKAWAILTEIEQEKANSIAQIVIDEWLKNYKSFEIYNKNIKFELNSKSLKDKIKNYIKVWETRCYHEGIPDEANTKLESLGKVPSYKLICMAILKNDHQLTTLGFSKQKCESYHIFKQIELAQRKQK